jgi:hypothetical protein
MSDAREAWLGLLVVSVVAFAAMGAWFALGLPEDGLGVAIIVAALVATIGYQQWLERTGRKPVPPRGSS